MNREVFCSCSMGSAVPLSYDLPTLPTFHSTFSEFLFSFSISPFLYFNNYQFSFPVILCFLLSPEFFFAFSHTCGVHQRIFSKRHFPTHALWSCATHTCTCSDCPLIFPIHQLVSHHLLGCSQMHRWRRNLNKLFSNGAAGSRFLFRCQWSQKEDWEECDGKISPFQSINAIACMQIISYQTRPNSLIQTIFFGRVTLALRTSLLNHRDHQSSSDNGKRFNIWDTQGKSELYGTWIRLRFPRNTFCPVCHRLSVYEEESVARSMYGEILSP